MPNKLSLFPNETTLNAAGNLLLTGHSAADLTRKFGTPLYVYHADTIRSKIDAYRQALSHYPGPARLTYASKAFLCPAIARLMTHAGVGLDAASAGEIFIASRGNANPAHMHLHGNNKTTLDLQAALQNGVGRIVVDNSAELDRLIHLAQSANQSVKIWLRITPDVGVKTHHRYTVTGTADSKFGFSPMEAQAAAHRLLHLPQSPVQLTGLHMHLGSHFQHSGPVGQAINRLFDVTYSLHEQYGWQMQEFCPGGGWGVRYHPDDPPMPIKPFVTGLVKAVEQGCRQRNLPLPELILEPGRSLIAQAGVALYTVGGHKTTADGRIFVSVDGGLADNPRPALYGARYTALVANRATEPEIETVSLAGPYCESGDILIDAVNLPPVKTGDIIAVPVAGAYQLSMSSNYNGTLRPAVVLIEGKTVSLMQRRETFEDLIARDI